MRTIVFFGLCIIAYAIEPEIIGNLPPLMIVLPIIFALFFDLSDFMRDEK